jgi:hypothetical protein
MDISTLSKRRHVTAVHNTAGLSCFMTAMDILFFHSWTIQRVDAAFRQKWPDNQIGSVANPV